jgi:hypothetical protein
VNDYKVICILIVIRNISTIVRAHEVHNILFFLL